MQQKTCFIWFQPKGRGVRTRVIKSTSVLYRVLIYNNTLYTIDICNIIDTDI